MKKLFTLVAAALMAVGVNAQGTAIELGGGWNAGFVADADVFHYEVNKLWGAAEFACNVSAADYPRFILEFEEPLPANFQINYLWKESADAEGNATAQYALAVGDGVKKTFEIPFMEGVGHNYITGVAVQHTDEVTANLAVKKMTLVAASGENKLVGPTFTTWAGTDLTKAYKGTVSFTSQWQQLYLKGVAGMRDLSITVKLPEVTPNVQMCVDYEDGTSEWPQFSGETASFTTKVGAVIKNCGIQYTAESGSASVVVDGAWFNPTTGVEKVEVAKAGSDFVNVAGQKVSKNYKGLVIDRASGRKIMK